MRRRIVRPGFVERSRDESVQGGDVFSREFSARTREQRASRTALVDRPFRAVAITGDARPDAMSDCCKST
jgi:hypothetical protein